MKGIVVTAIEGSPGRVILAFYERHEPGEAGAIMRKELELHELAELHSACTKALWHLVGQKK